MGHDGHSIRPHCSGSAVGYLDFFFNDLHALLDISKKKRIILIPPGNLFHCAYFTRIGRIGHADLSSHGKETYIIEFWDTRAEEGHDRLRPLAYPGSHLLLLCFSVASRDSFENLTEKWVHEVAYFCFHIPMVLIGTHADVVRHSDHEKSKFEDDVQIKEIRKLMKRLKWSNGHKRGLIYVECDAREAADVDVIPSEVRASSARCDGTKDLPFVITK